MFFILRDVQSECETRLHTQSWRGKVPELMELNSQLTQPITGFPEWLPAERLLEVRMIDTIREVYERYGFAPIETPAVEKDETLQSKGEINKQIYSLFRPNVPADVDKETGLSLHFDLTVPLARYVAQHYGKLVFPFRRYQIQKVWRGERAQKGRFREFYQCDIDIIGEGSLDLMADAEMPLIIFEVFNALDIGQFVIRISNRKILQGLLQQWNVVGEQAEETFRAIDRLPKLKGGWQELQAWLIGELKLTSDICDILRQLLVEEATQVHPLEKLKQLNIPNEVFQQGISELQTVLELAKSQNLPEGILKTDLSITRGLDYYTGTVYETFLVGYENVLGSICSGGRYDNLASHFTDRTLPGVGVSIGLSRLFSTLLDRGLLKPTAHTPAQVMITIPDRQYLLDAFQVAGVLRRNGLKVELYAQDAKHDRQLKTAVRKGIPFAVIPWPERMKEERSVEVRNLSDGKRENVPLEQLAGYLLLVVQKAEDGAS